MRISGELWIGKPAGEIIQGKNSFDIIRYFLSFAVLVGHFRVITGIPYYFPMSSVDAVHGFFILSGFLVFYRCVPIFHYIEDVLVGYYFIFIVTLCWWVECFCFYFFCEGIFSRLSCGNIYWQIFFLNFIEPALPGCFHGGAVIVRCGQ
ncbi:MAG: hypothetical protein ACLTTW_01870 [Coprobacter sp.]